MNKLNSPLLTFALLAGFLWLAHKSQEQVPYDTAGLSKLVGSTQSFKQRQAAALKDVWFLSDNDIAKPVELFK